MAVNDSNAAAVIEAMQGLLPAETIDLPQVPQIPANQQIIALPKGYDLHSLKRYQDEYRIRPELIDGTAELLTLASFIDHVKRFQGPDTAVFASTTKLQAVYDYHNRGPADAQPNNCTHRAVYTFPLSSEWKAWTSMHGNNMQQSVFAQFLEDRIADVTAPTDKDAEHFGELGFTLATPAQLLSLSRGLHVRVESEAVSKPNLSTGELEVLFKEQHTDTTGQPLKVPGGFMILVPPFLDGALYRIPVRLRYRVASGKVVWSVLIYRTNAVLRDAVKDACEQVVRTTSVALFHGKPESVE